MKIEIVSRFTAAVLFSLDVDRNNIRLTLEAAISQKADLREADLREADLRGADLYGANLRGADLYGANLREANLYGANLREANLRGADLYGADLRGADLYGANLREANLYGANLREANLRGANLYGANAVIAAGNPDGWFAYGWQLAGKLRLQVGCQSKDLQSAREYWAGKDNRREVLLAVEYIAAIAALRGWGL